MFNFHNQNIAIRIDIEGHELAALIGSEKLLIHNNILLQIEVHPKNTATFDYLNAQGFTRLHDINGDFYFERCAISQA